MLHVHGQSVRRLRGASSGAAYGRKAAEAHAVLESRWMHGAMDRWQQRWMHGAYSVAEALRKYSPHFHACAASLQTSSSQPRHPNSLQRPATYTTWAPRVSSFALRAPPPPSSVPFSAGCLLWPWSSFPTSCLLRTGIPVDIVALAVPVSLGFCAFGFTIFRAFAYDPEW
jgi:hypothetical protein